MLHPPAQRLLAFLRLVVSNVHIKNEASHNLLHFMLIASETWHESGQEEDSPRAFFVSCSVRTHLPPASTSLAPGAPSLPKAWPRNTQKAETQTEHEAGRLWGPVTVAGK